jgi:hypothetical protein
MNPGYAVISTDVWNGQRQLLHSPARPIEYSLKK